MFGVGTGEVLVILVITMLVVGPERMVELASELGRMIAKFRQETSSVTEEFREALSLEADERKVENAAQGDSEQAIATTDALPETHRAQPETVAGELENAVVAPSEPETSIAAVPEAVFSDSETRVVGAGWDSGNGSGKSDSPINVQVAQFVPEDEEVEPTVLGGPVLMADEGRESSADEEAEGPDVSLDGQDEAGDDE